MNRQQFFKYHGYSQQEQTFCTEYCRRFWKQQVEHILRIADEVVQQTFLFDLPWDMEPTTEAVTFEESILWDYMPSDDPEFIYQLNRHRYWICLGQAYLLTGEEQYVSTFIRQMKEWLQSNPINEVTKKTTWRTIEAGMRAENWIKAMAYMEHSPQITQEVMDLFERALILHGEYLMCCDAPFSMKSNWGVLENSGLYAIGKVLENDTYGRTALVRLEKQIQIQVMADGIHWEQSPMYHNEVLRCYLEVLRLAEVYDDHVADSTIQKVKDMAYASRIMQMPNHTQPMNGDSDQIDLRDILTGAAYIFRDPVLKSGGYPYMDFEGIWLYGSYGAHIYDELEMAYPQCLLSGFPDSGNWYLRSGWDEHSDYLHFTNGCLGGGHGHFDKLHLDLVIDGEEVLIDSGRYTYVDGLKRYRLKSAMAHNTITVDGISYSSCLDSWGVRGLMPPVNSGTCQIGKYTLLQGGHLGYMDKGVYVNRKILAIGTRIYLVMDTGYAIGTHLYEQHYHVPSWKKLKQTEYGFISKGRRIETEFHILGKEDRLSFQESEISRHYNQSELAYEAIVSRSGEGRTSLFTVIIGREKDDNQQVHVAKVPIDSPVSARILSDDEAEAVRITYGSDCYTVIFSHVETGADCEYIGAGGFYGIGRVMVGESGNEDAGLMVLEW